MSDKKEKKYSLSKEQLSEMSYIASQRTASMEVANFWDKRLERFMDGVRSILGIPMEYDVNWNDVFVGGTIVAIPKELPKKEEAHADTQKKV